MSTLNSKIIPVAFWIGFLALGVVTHVANYRF